MALLDPRERSERGAALQAEINDRPVPAPATPVEESLRDFAYAEVWSRPGLDRRSRYLISIAGAIMSAADPAKMQNTARIEGSFAVGKGALGTFDLSRVLQTSGKQYGGRTLFTELSGHGVYDRGAVALRNVNISAGALSAGASADIAPSGALVGRVVADIRTTAQPLRATLTLGGTLKEPQVRN